MNNKVQSLLSRVRSYAREQVRLKPIVYRGLLGFTPKKNVHWVAAISIYM